MSNAPDPPADVERGRPIIVLKFGSSVLRDCADLPAAVQEIYRWYRTGWCVIAVVSALGDTTERLLKEARTLTAVPEPSATAELLATGERQAAALLAIALDRAGIRARATDPRDIGFVAVGDVLDSEPELPDGVRLRALLESCPVLIVPGFFAYTPGGQLHLLGRGGSDLSAVCIAEATGAQRCRLLKDVDGVYEADPANAQAAAPRRYATLGYAQALACAGRLIQPKAVRFLEQRSATAEVAALASFEESVIGPLDTAHAPPVSRRPASVLLLGAGTVGHGVYQRLLSMPAQFEVAGVLVRDAVRHLAQGIEARHLCQRNDVWSTDADVVIDALPGVEPSFPLVRHFLGRGISVVTANKQLIATAGPELSAHANSHGARLCYSAAVGGSAPMIELLRRGTPGNEPAALAGVLNGTCNDVLDCCAAGTSFEEAVKAAQAAGFAETDPGEDLSGRDALRKLRILARHAFGSEVQGVECEALSAASIARARASLRRGQSLRQIARARRTHAGVVGSVRLEAVDAGDALAAVRGEWNALVVTLADGATLTVRGRGAGRWPTATAVMADLLDLGSRADTRPLALWGPS